jgi:geranylgeranyl diphosphate synthase type II
MESAGQRIERALERAFTAIRDKNGPPRLGEALRYAVFPGGARLRPRLTIAVAEALGDPDPALTDAAAVGLELVHCASLVHDDLPSFDNASTRRGRPSVHAAFDEATALLTGDGLIVMGFQALAMAKTEHRERIVDLVLCLSRGVGHPNGIVAGQAWEAEPGVRLFAYHRAKTASLFEAACALGAASVGHDPGPWRVVGELLGRAYQVADDLADAVESEATTGKTAKRDREHGRPSAYERLGEVECRRLVERLLVDASNAVPKCPGREPLREWLGQVTLGVLSIRLPGLASAALPTARPVETALAVAK